MSTSHDYVDHEDFHDVQDGPAFQTWTTGMEQNRPAHTDELDGTLELYRDDGVVLALSLRGRQATWRVKTAPNVSDGHDWFTSPAGSAPVEVMALPEDVYFIDLHIHAADQGNATCATIIYDRSRKRALIVYSWTFDRGGERRSKSAIHAAGVGAPATDPIRRTADLVGRRAMWVYSDDHAYEHIYLNYGTYAWHCLRGPERSIADVDRTETWKITDQIYVFFVTETVFPWDGVFVLNFTPGAMTNIGRFFGWDPKPNALAHKTFGARGRILNQTDYTFPG